MAKKSRNKEIVASMTFGEILNENPKAGEILAERGMFCGGCPMAQLETLENGAEVHGLSQKELEKLIKELNKL